MVARIECHQQRDGNVLQGLTHAVPNDNPAGPALCGAVIHDASMAMWRSVAHADAWELPARSPRCAACLAAAPV
jgi:hypothetical protein